MGDEIVSNVVGTMLEPIRDSLYAFISRQFGYLVHCKKNIKDFEDEVKKLKDAMEMIQTRVNEAENNAEVIERNVSRWLDEVQSTLRTMEEVRSRLLQNAENLQCLDVCSRYRLGKEGKKKKPVVTKLIQDGNNFGTVGHRPPLTRTWLRTHTINYESFESRELVFNDIMEALKDDRNYKIGIHGMPGVGKTRMMEEVAKQAREDKLFDQIAKTVVSENPNLEQIQKQLAEALNLTLDKDTEGARKELLHNRLKSDKRILLMVDDLWNDGIKLEDIGIPATGEHTIGCKILLTSRRPDVCEAMGVPEKENFQIGILSKAEAWSFFEKKVGDSIEPHQIAEAVCEECAGLPLAILAVGGALKNKSTQIWEDALEQLRNSRTENIAGLPANLYSRIKLSYNYLENDDAKSLFLFCCLFPEDAEIPIDYLVRFGFGLRLLRGMDTIKKARNRAHAMVGTLKTSSLLLEGRDKETVKMHDVIRDVAISIASKEEDAMFLVRVGVEKWPEEDEYKQCRAISLLLNYNCVLPDDLECPKLSTLILTSNMPPRVLKLVNRILTSNEMLTSNILSGVPCSFFNGMEKLEVLYLKNMWIESLPSSLQNLRMLHLDDSIFMNLGCLGELEKLEILIIKYDGLQRLPPKIGLLTRLRLLDLRKCDELKILSSGIISSLSQLEELHIPAEFERWGVEGNASINELNSLKRLTSLEVHVPNVELLPLNELMFKSLIRFQISIGSVFYSSEIRPSATKILKLEGFPLKRELNILMEKAEVLYLSSLEGLKDVFHNREGEGFLDLKYLEVVDCDGVEHLFGKPKLISHTTRPRTSGSFSQLSVLEVAVCGSSYLFSTATARGLLQLQELTIRNCEMLEEIISDDQEVMMDTVSFHGLKKMNLDRLPNLRSFFYVNMKKTSSTTRCNTSTHMQALFNHKVAFPALEKLEIENLGSLTAIWDDQLQSLLVKEVEDSFRRLMYMKVSRCEKLVNVIPSNMIPRLQNLKTLEVFNCDSVLYEVEVVVSVEKGYPKEATPTINVLPRLQVMVLRNLQNLVMSIRLQRLCAYSNLTNLHLSNRNSLGNAFSPSTARYLVHLQNLRVENCEKMEEIVAVEKGQLGEEDVVHDDDIIVFLQLKVLELWKLPNLKTICNCTRGSKKQEEETVEQNISIVEALFNHKVRFPALEKLKIKELKSLTAIWDNQLFLGSGAQDSFRQLRLVTVQSCDKLVNVIPPNAIPMLQILESLKIVSCDSMISGVEVAAIEEGRDEILMFPQLKKLKLKMLPKISSLCCSRRGGEQKVVEESNISQLQALFNHKVEFPMLEELVCDGGIFEDIWLGHLPTSGSFSKVRILELKKYSNIVNGCRQLLQWFEVVGKIHLESWYSLEVIFNLEGVDDAIQRKAIIVMSSQLQELTLIDLPELKSIWKREPRGRLLMFHNLTSLTVKECNSLRYIFSSFSIVRRLPQLRELEIRDSDAMEEIVVNNEEQGGEEDSIVEIVFSQLQNISLVDLPKLSSFCGANNAVFKFPSLLRVQMYGCPKLQTFASGGISMPPDTRVDRTPGYHLSPPRVSDLNKNVQQHFRKGKGLQTMDNDNEEEYSSDSFLYLGTFSGRALWT